METFIAVVSFVLGALVSGMIQILLAIAFEPTFRRYYRASRRRFLLIMNSLRNSPLPIPNDRFSVGPWEINVTILEGTPREPFLHEKITCHLEEEFLALPSELAELHDEVDMEQEIIEEQKGRRDFHNGAMVALIDYHQSYTHVIEDPTLFLRFKRTDYYAFLATAMKIDEISPGSSSPAQTLRAKYLGRGSYRKPNPFFATSFGVNVAVVTNDEYIVIGRRSDHRVSHYHGALAVPVMESVNPMRDRNPVGQLDVYEAASRGLREELGVEIQDKRDIRFFTLCVDNRHYLYGLTGLVRVEQYSRNNISALRSQGVRDWWENPDLYFLPFDPQSVGEFIKREGGPAVFHPTSFVAIVQALVYECGEKAVVKAFS